MTSEAQLPAEFADLEPFAKDWALAREDDRYTRRLTSTMAELQAFYGAVAPQAEKAIAYLNQFDLEDLSDQAQNLLRVMYSFITVSFAVDIFKQPRIPDSGATFLYAVIEPVP
jgi:hypothetical protein